MHKIQPFPHPANRLMQMNNTINRFNNLICFFLLMLKKLLFNFSHLKKKYYEDRVKELKKKNNKNLKSKLISFI